MITREEYTQRRERVGAALDAEGLDALIAFSSAKVQANVRYLTSYFVRFVGMQSTPEGYHMFGSCVCLLPKEGEPVVRTDQPWDVARAQEMSLFPDTDYAPSFAAHLGPMIKARGYRRVGIDNWYVFPAREFLDLQREAPGVEFVPTHLMSQVRRVKSPAEIEILRRAAQASDVAVQAALDAVDVGKNEYEVALVAEYTLRERGEQELGGQSIIGCGPNTATGTSVPVREKVIGAGEWVMFDICPRVDGYCGDISRHRLAGEMSELDPRLKHLYDACLVVSEEAIKAVKPGTSGRDLSDRATEVSKQEGVAEYRSGLLGHGVGLDIHDIPDYYYDPSPLSAGEVITVEPAFFIPGLGGVRIEDMVLVTEGGGEQLTKTNKALTPA